RDLGDGRWTALAKPGKRLKLGTRIDFRGELAGEVLAKLEGGVVVLGLAGSRPMAEILDEFGEAPLPPYIERPTGADSRDSRRYQTIYSRYPGSVAAPTAGLHFTPNLLERLRARGVEWLTLTLHVGYGTFAPLPEGDLTGHRLHTESFTLGKSTARGVNRARLEGRRVIAVGTTTARVLEAAADETGIVTAASGETELFIHPPYRFKSVDGLLTNFHLPRSSLLMLVAALAGRERILDAYREAIAEGYRFYSYGDATLLLPTG
ncbi:MAG: tRNA preQ1(34) S-adenosylmethionine ribosyltransferase-isomerase QueA, partial [bacterium]|nr:tRNA preQ1(34) S-adenosylmethionine ribosyltransferase-isomerase QueA [bacterium]